MINKTRERAKRFLLASFLKSDLTIKELQELVRDITNNPSFMLEFGELLEDVICKLQHNEPKSLPGLKKTSFDISDKIYAIIQRQRLPKKKLLEIMEEASPGISRYAVNVKMPAQDMLRVFFDYVSKVEADRFLSIISPFTDDDEYLRGILKKR